jgi:hypothetical protein
VGSCLNFTLSVLSTGLSHFLTINGNDSFAGVSGSLFSGGSYSYDIYMPTQYWVLEPTNIYPTPFGNMTVPLDIQTQAAADLADDQVNVKIVNCIPSLLGSWSGTCAAGHLNGLWILNIIQAYAAVADDLSTLSEFTWQGTIPYYNTNGQLRSIAGAWHVVVTNLNMFTCGPTLVVGSPGPVPFAAPSDCSASTWALAFCIPLNVVSGQVIYVPPGNLVLYPGSFFSLDAPGYCTIPQCNVGGDFGGSGTNATSLTGSRGSP